MTKLVGPYAAATVALLPRVSVLRMLGTSGALYVMLLNNAWFVPSSIVANRNSSSMVRSASGIALTAMGTSAVSLTSWYASMVPRLVRGADALYVMDEVTSVRAL